MLPQEIAVEKIKESLIKDKVVQAVFLKGSMGREEHDEHSDIDLYCLVSKEDEKAFLARRAEHLQAYRPIMFLDDIFIIAPQLIAVYDDLLHIDLFTVTRESFVEKDYFKVLYDPSNRLKPFEATQTLALSDQELMNDLTDVAWFLFQYKKSAARGNDIWSVRMLTNVVHHLARVLLYKYAPERAQLGMKTLEHSLPETVSEKIEDILEFITPSSHHTAACKLGKLLNEEQEWIVQTIPEEDQIKLLLQKMIDIHYRSERSHCND